MFPPVDSRCAFIVPNTFHNRRQRGARIKSEQHRALIYIQHIRSDVDGAANREYRYCSARWRDALSGDPFELLEFPPNDRQRWVNRELLSGVGSDSLEARGPLRRNVCIQADVVMFIHRSRIVGNPETVSQIRTDKSACHLKSAFLGSNPSFCVAKRSSFRACDLRLQEEARYTDN